MKTALTIAVILVVAGLSALGQTINFNIGEPANGREKIDGEIWNHLGDGSYSTIYDSTGTRLLSDVAIQVDAIYASKGGLGLDADQGRDYISKALNPMTESFVYAYGDSPTAASQTRITITGLGANSEWALVVFAGLNKAPRQQSISINGGAAVNYVTDNTTDGTYTQNSSIRYSSVFADDTGTLTIDLNGIPAVNPNVSFVQGLTLKRVSEPPIDEIPEPSSYPLIAGLIALASVMSRRQCYSGQRSA